MNFPRTIPISKFEAGRSDLHLSCSFSSLLSRAARSRGTGRQEVTRRCGWVLNCCCGNPRSRSRTKARSGFTRRARRGNSRWRSRIEGWSGFTRFATQTAAATLVTSCSRRLWVEPFLSRARFELVRIFLSPLFAFACMDPRDGARRVPPHVSHFPCFTGYLSGVREAQELSGKSARRGAGTTAWRLGIRPPE